MSDLDAVARHYRGFAVATRGQSACLETWSRGVADDPAVLAWIADLPRGKQQPNLVFASARWHGVPAPGPYAGLRHALHEQQGVLPTVTATATERPDDWLSFVLGVDGRAVALTHQHGAGIRWL